MIMKKYYLISILLIMFSSISCELTNSEDKSNCDAPLSDTTSTPITRLYFEKIECPFPKWFKGTYSQVFYNIPDEHDDSITMIIPTAKKASEIKKIEQNICCYYYIFDILTNRNRFSKFTYFESIKIPITKGFNPDSLFPAIRFSKHMFNKRITTGKQITKKPDSVNKSSQKVKSDIVTQFKLKKGDLPLGFRSILKDNYEIFIVDDSRRINKFTKKLRILIPCTSDTEIEQITNTFNNRDLGINIYIKNQADRPELNKLAYLEIDLNDTEYDRRNRPDNFIFKLFAIESFKDGDEDPEEVKVIDADIDAQPFYPCLSLKAKSNDKN